jgi:glycine cleavage system transcriptional repressor
MKHWLMLTVVGRDRPGIVAALTDALYRSGANLGEASMTRLGGNFTIMLMAHADADAATLERSLAPTAKQFELRLHIDVIDGTLHQHVEPNVSIVVHGADRPGIVAQVTSLLASQGFNVLELKSDVGGTEAQPIYVMMLNGYSERGAAALQQVLAPIRAGGVEVRVNDIDTLIG